MGDQCRRDARNYLQSGHSSASRSGAGFTNFTPWDLPQTPEAFVSSRAYIVGEVMPREEMEEPQPCRLDDS